MNPTSSFMGKRLPFFFLLLIFLFTRCKKDTANPSTQNDLYISGTLGSGDTSHAVYWKNGNLVILPGDGLPSAAGNIAVSGTDVYVAGRKGNGFGYWKNGNYVSLNDTFNLSFSLAVSAGDIYMMSTLPNGNYYMGGYYKNGEFFRISSPDSINTNLTAIAVNGQDLLLGEIETDGSKPSVAKYLLNGTAHDLTDGTKFAYVYGVAFARNDIYVVGGEFDASGKYCTAKYWKNGIPYNVSDTTGYNMGTHIAISGINVYVSGYGYEGPFISAAPRTAKYWRNGVQTRITDGAYDSEASWVEVSGTDVYVVFQEFTQGIFPVAKYLKNGTLVQLTDPATPAVAYSSLVAPASK
jgi:hypothetical protein